MDCHGQLWSTSMFVILRDANIFVTGCIVRTIAYCSPTIRAHIYFWQLAGTLTSSLFATNLTLLVQCVFGSRAACIAEFSRSTFGLNRTCLFSLRCLAKQCKSFAVRQLEFSKPQSDSVVMINKRKSLHT